jgi:hypothetical protein
VSFGAFTEGRDEAAVVAGAGGQDDVARLDAFEGNRGEIGAQAGDAGAGRDDGHGLRAGDEFELVLDGFDEGTVGCRVSVGSGVDAPEGVPGGVGRSTNSSDNAMTSSPSRRCNDPKNPSW